MKHDFHHRCTFLKDSKSCDSPAVGILKLENPDGIISSWARCRECLHTEYLNMNECKPFGFEECKHVAYELGKEAFEKGLDSPSVLNDDFFKWVPKTTYYFHRKERAYLDLCAYYNKGWANQNLKQKVL